MRKFYPERGCREGESEGSKRGTAESTPFASTPHGSSALNASELIHSTQDCALQSRPSPAGRGSGTANLQQNGPGRRGQGFLALLLLLFLAPYARAETFTVFGSAAYEAQLTPPNTGSPLNPGNIARIPYRTNSADATLYADAKGDTWKLHLKLGGDASDQAGDRGQVGEAYARITPSHWLTLAAGRVIEKWGTGYAWNPTAFISPQKNPVDPNDRRGAYRGLDMIRADIFARGTNVSLYALGGGATAARVYRLIAGTDVSVNVRHDHDGTQQGLSLARVFGDALELHAEAARRRVVAGGQYTFAGSNINVVGELYRDGAGLTPREWQAFTERPSNAAYRPLRMGRTYGFARADWPSSDGKTEAELIAITSIRDGSLLARLTLTRKLRPNVSVYVIDTEFAGRAATELSYVQVRRATTLGVRWFY